MLKVITIYNQETESMEEVILEELQVFKVNCAIYETYIQLSQISCRVNMSKKPENSQIYNSGVQEIFESSTYFMIVNLHFQPKFSEVEL